MKGACASQSWDRERGARGKTSESACASLAIESAQYIQTFRVPLQVQLTEVHYVYVYMGRGPWQIHAPALAAQAEFRLVCVRLAVPHVVRKRIDPPATL